MQPFEISYYVLLIALFLLGLVFFFIPVRQDERLRHYRISLRLIALSYIALGVYCIFKWRYPQQLFSIPFLAMANLQAILLGVSHVNLVAPARVGRRFVLTAVAPPLAWTIVYGIVRLFCPHAELLSYGMLAQWWYAPEVLVRILWLLSYVVQVVWFALVFFRDARQLKAPVPKASFILALSVAAVTIGITTCLSPEGAVVLNYLILILYVAMGILYVQYPATFFKISSLLFDGDAQARSWQAMRAKIVSDGLYLREGVTEDDIARELGVSRNRLSALVNAGEGVNFSTFIGQLRVEKAMELMRTDSRMPLSEISASAGFSDASNFSRQFKRLTGESPAEFRKKL